MYVDAPCTFRLKGVARRRRETITKDDVTELGDLGDLGLLKPHGSGPDDRPISDLVPQILDTSAYVKPLCRGCLIFSSEVNGLVEHSSHNIFWVDLTPCSRMQDASVFRYISWETPTVYTDNVIDIHESGLRSARSGYFLSGNLTGFLGLSYRLTGTFTN